MSLGPVQDFIATARKCHDLWSGSWLLSELSKAAADGAQQAAGGLETLIFPGATAARALAAGSESSIANKLVARVPGGAAEARRVAEAASQGWTMRLDDLAECAIERVGKGDPERDRHLHVDRARDQIRDLIEFVWVAVEEGPGGEGNPYALARREAERLLQARKNTRLWQQPSWADTVPKSSLDGARESVLDERLFGRNPALSPDRLRAAYGVHPSERLSGVGLLKRWASVSERGDSSTPRFFSTSHMAGRPLMLGASSHPGFEPAITAFVNDLRAVFGESGFAELETAPAATGAWGRVDGQVLFPERLSEALEEAGVLTAGRGARRGEPQTDAHKALRRLQRALGIAGAYPYYAILLADGDRMGRAIDAIASHEVHRQLSQVLDEFAQGARAVVEDHEGSLVYSGGDDVLALLPLHRAVACADELRRGFASALAPVVPDKVGVPTLSVGIGVCHHIDRMDQSFEVARRAERLAKTQRNALAIILAPRGGSETEVVGGWEEPGGLSLADRLHLLEEMHRDGAIAERAGFELAGLELLAGEGAPPEAFFRAEGERILSSKRASGGGDMDEGVREQLRHLAGPDPARLGRELIVSRALAAAARQARLATTGGEA